MGYSCPLHEFDDVREAFIEPSMLRNVHLEETMPEDCVFTFSNSLIQQLLQNPKTKKIGYLQSPIEKTDIFQTEFKGRPVAFLQIPVGAAAAVIRLERVIATGVKNIVVFGSAGVLDHQIQAGDLMIPISAIRDEGTSYHYLPPSREVEMSPAVVAAITAVLDRHQVSYQKCKTWTTDAIFRETAHKVARRKREGCFTVEMECSALLAVAHFRGVKLVQLLYGMDSLGGVKWDSRDEWRKTEGDSALERIFHLAVEIATQLSA